MNDEIIIEINKKTNSNKNNTAKKSKKNKLNRKNKSKKNSTRNEQKQIKNRKLPKIIMIIIICFIILLIIFSSSLFDIKKIEVIGNEKITDELIISLSKLELYQNIFKFNKSDVITNIKENSYIESTSISRKLPGTIIIEVEERVPKYMLQIADSYAYINNQGYILEITNERLSLPILTGASTDISKSNPGDRINLEDLKKLDKVIKIYETAKSNELNDLITIIDISDDRNYTIILEKEGKTVYLGDCSNLNTRILYLKSILEASSGKKGEIFLNIDLNSDNVYFRPSSN